MKGRSMAAWEGGELSEGEEKREKVLREETASARDEGGV